MKVPLTCRGKSYNGQSVEEHVWENVGPFEMAKVTGDYVLWAYEGSTHDFTWRVETRDGDTVAFGHLNCIGFINFETFYESCQLAQQAADAVLLRRIEGRID